ECACALGRFDGVLVDIGSGLAVGQFSSGGDGAGVDFPAPRQRASGQAGDSRDLQVDGPGCLVDGGGEQVNSGPGGRSGGGSGRAVKPDDGVEVDDAAPLVFSHLGEGDADLGGKRVTGQPGLSGDGPAQGDGEPSPYFRRGGVEQDGTGVVVAIGAQRLSEA